MTTDLHDHATNQRDHFEALAAELECPVATVVADTAAQAFARIAEQIARCAGLEPMARAAR